MFGRREEYHTTGDDFTMFFCVEIHKAMYVLMHYHDVRMSQKIVCFEYWHEAGATIKDACAYLGQGGQGL